ncbi:TadE/TadG family type IV pilus assembly protein [Rhizobium sp. C4]|uniref:TadE/TadG family type IV pilus assembly protein n=1 Tax=Rhizobium sp. C4 TaxID=1349800 RepID=UPI001E2C8B6C|nr:Tad domain-containing protein [Rhizobium sp. C4]MCD2171847.1 pilus assembly protein TadG-related protein [Rhizobium sp. C4]
MTFALLVTPLVIAIGTGIDLARAYNVQTRIQADLDSSLIAAVKSVSSLDNNSLKQKVSDWFVATGNLSAANYSIASVAVDTSNQSVSAKVTATVPTTFMRIAGIKTVPVAATSTAKGPTTSYLQVYIVLDKSASMLLPSSQSDRTKFQNLLYNNSYSDSSATKHNYVKCEFACHDFDGPYFKYNGSIYNNIYDVVKSYNSSNASSPITLRTDTAVAAAQQVVSMAAKSNATTNHIQVGLYYLGADLYQSVAPTYSSSALTKALTTDSYGLTSATSQPVSYFDIALATLTKLVGSAGNGGSASSPLKLVLLLTDGVESSRPWVTNGTWGSWGYYYSATTSTPQGGANWNNVAPMNPGWCSSMKTNGVTIGVLNTEYLAIDYDWGYVATLSRPMSSTNWTSTYGGVMRASVPASTSKRDYLQYALSDCATSSSLFIKASDQNEIQNGLSSIFNQYLNSVRLTN